MDKNVEAPVTRRFSETETGEGCRRYLPQDTVYNILARVPAKSICRFKMVCKNWRDMITELDPIIVQQSMSKVTIIYRRTAEESRSLFFKFKTKDTENCCLSLETDYIWAEKACDKFVLFRCEFPATYARMRPVVCDTIEDRFRQLPKIPLDFTPWSSYDDYSLVYDASAKICKVIMFYCKCSIQTCYIYSFNDNDQWESGSSKNWRTLTLPCSQKIMKSSNSAIDVNGVLYWLAELNFKEYGVFIQPMDIATEKFKTFIKLPCQPCEMNCNLLKIKESLCFMNTAFFDELHIWVLKNSVEILWILQHKISLSSMVGRPTPLNSFLFHGFHPWLVVEGSINSYILATVDDFLAPYWYNLETKELSEIALAYENLEAFHLPEELRRLDLDYNFSAASYLQTILFIDDLGPDFQSRLTGFVTEKHSQRNEEERLRRDDLLRLSIDDLVPDLQSRLTGFVAAEQQRQRDEEEGLRRDAL